VRALDVAADGHLPVKLHEGFFEEGDAGCSDGNKGYARVSNRGRKERRRRKKNVQIVVLCCAALAHTVLLLLAALKLHLHVAAIDIRVLVHVLHALFQLGLGFDAGLLGAVNLRLYLGRLTACALLNVALQTFDGL
jgi:hypothetical protein